MRDLSYLTEYYTNYNEQGRLTSRHGSVEYFTTMKYIHEVLKPGDKLCEIGAGTGRYTLTLAAEGYEVSAVELIEHNLDILREGIKPEYKVDARQGDALDLSFYKDESFDLTLVLGPMYHLYNDADKIRALSEALRITKPGGYIFVAYCMNDATIVSFEFVKGHIHENLEKNMITEDYHCKSEPKDCFELVRTEDIARIDAAFDIERVKLIATDGATNYMREVIDSMDDKTFDLFLDYHLKTCERQDLIGATFHSLDILRKK